MKLMRWMFCGAAILVLAGCVVLTRQKIEGTRVDVSGTPGAHFTVKVEGEPPREFTAGSQAVAVFQTSEKYFAFEIVKEDPEAALTVELVRGWELPISPRSGRLSSGVEKVTIGGRARSRQVIGLLEGVAYF